MMSVVESMILACSRVIIFCVSLISLCGVLCGVQPIDPLPLLSCWQWRSSQALWPAYWQWSLS